MTKVQAIVRIATYEQALALGKITKQEFDGFVAALAQILAMQPA